MIDCEAGVDRWLEEIGILEVFMYFYHLSVLRRPIEAISDYGFEIDRNSIDFSSTV